jgi:hypothetical protein
LEAGSIWRYGRCLKGLKGKTWIGYNPYIPSLRGPNRDNTIRSSLKSSAIMHIGG